LETDDAAAWLHASPNLVRDFAKAAAKELSQLTAVDATSLSSLRIFAEEVVNTALSYFSLQICGLAAKRRSTRAEKSISVPIFPQRDLHDEGLGPETSRRTYRKIRKTRDFD
jgi:hypothetical protein